MSTRPLVAAEPRAVTGKKVASLRRVGILPAVVYGHGHESQAIQLDAHQFDVLRRHVGRNALLDLKVGSGKVTPVLLQHVHEHPVARRPIHADFYVVKMSEEITVEVPLSLVGDAHAVERLGGTLLLLRDNVQVRALPAELPDSLEVDVATLDSFEAVLHVRDITLPPRVTVVTDADEIVAKVQPPRTEAVVAAPEAAVEGEVAAEGQAASAEDSTTANA